MVGPGARECIHLHHQRFGLRPSLPVSHQLLLPFPAEREEGRAVSLSYFPSGSAPTVVSHEASKNQREQGLRAEGCLYCQLDASVRFQSATLPQHHPYLPKGPSPKGSPTSDVHT